MPGDRAGEHGGAHDRQGGGHEPGFGGQQRAGHAGHADALQRQSAERPGGEGARHEAQPAQRPLGSAMGPRRRLGGFLLQAAQAFGGDPRLAVRGRQPVADGHAAEAGGGGGDALGALVALGHLGGHGRPGEALRALARVRGHLCPPRLVEGQPAQGLGEGERVARGHEHPVEPVADHVAVAGDVRGQHRRARREGLRQDHAEALAAERGGAQHVGRLQLRQLARLVDLAERAHAVAVEHHVGDLGLPRTDDRERRRDLLAQRLEGGQQHGQTLAFHGLPDEHDPQRLLRAAWLGLRRRRDADAVGDHRVAPAVEAPRGPGGGLRDGDAPVQAVHPPAATEHHRGPAVGEEVLRVGVEGAHQGQRSERAQRVPAEHRDDRLVDVEHVVAAVAQLVAHPEEPLREHAQVGDGAVGGDADGAPERDEALVDLDLLGRRAAVQAAGELVVGVVRRQHPHVVVGRAQLACQCVDVAGDATRIGPGVRRQQRDPHDRAYSIAAVAGAMGAGRWLR